MSDSQAIFRFTCETGGMQRSTATPTVRESTEPTSLGKRIYAQMRPDAEGIGVLSAVQSDLSVHRNGRLIGPDELHLTLIHFGKADEVFQAIGQVSEVSREAFDEQLSRYVTTTTSLLPDRPIDLAFDSFDLFGPKRTALVATFQPSEELIELHTKLFGALVDFLERIHVPAPLEFMANDPNFKHAMTCNPHVTLYKGYDGELPHGSFETMRFTAMDVMY